MLTAAALRTTKRCPRCTTTKARDEFRAEASRHDGLAPYCRECEPTVRREKYLSRKEAHNAYARAYQKARPHKRAEWARRYALKKHYGLTPEDWERMYQEQGGRCLICALNVDREDMHVDHCHDTNVVRGLLCSGCNTGIGLLRHDVDILRRAIDYLERVAA